MHYATNETFEKLQLKQLKDFTLYNLLKVKGIISESYLPMSKMQSASIILDSLMDILVKASKKHAFI